MLIVDILALLLLYPEIPHNISEEMSYNTVWDHLADCESGEWNRNAEPIHGSARWNLRPGEHIFEGGLQFHPDTWRAFSAEVPGDLPERAYLATRLQQIRVAEEVLKVQGWSAWPVCSIKIGVR